MSQFLKYHPLNFNDENDYSIRSLAANNKMDLLKYFLTLPGIDIIKQCQLSLIWATGRYHINIVKYLLNVLKDHNADIKNQFFLEALGDCIFENKKEMVKCFLIFSNIEECIIERSIFYNKPITNIKEYLS